MEKTQTSTEDSVILTSLANIPPILLKVGICIPYLSNSCLMALISSSENKIQGYFELLLLNCCFTSMVNI